MEEKFCPCCGRHCSLEEPNCGRGVEFAKTGTVPTGHTHGERKDDKRRERKQKYLSMDVNSKLIQNIRDLGHIVRSFSDGKAGQSRILIMLSECKSVTQSELTERLGVQPGTVSEVLGKLEKSDLICRVTDENDKRTCVITLTEQGADKAIELKAEREQRYTEMFESLSDEEQMSLLGLLEKVNVSWRRRYGRHHGEQGKHKFHGGCGRKPNDED